MFDIQTTEVQVMKQELESAGHYTFGKCVTSCFNCLLERYFGVQSCSGSLEVLETYQKGCRLQLVHCTAPLLSVLVFAEECQGGTEPEGF